MNVFVYIGVVNVTFLKMFSQSMELFNGYVNLDRIIKILRFWGKWVFIQTNACVISVPRLGSLPSRDT